MKLLIDEQIVGLIYLAVLFSTCQKNNKIQIQPKQIPLPFTENLSSIYFTDQQNGYITGGDTWTKGFVLSTENGGTDWQIDTVLNKKMEKVRFDSLGNGFAVGLEGLALYLPKGRKRAWQPFLQQWKWYRSCWFFDDNNGFIVGGEGLRNGSVQQIGPERWQIDSTFDFPNEITDLAFADRMNGTAVGAAWILNTKNGGKTWERLQITGDIFKSIHFPSKKTGYVCGYAGTILKTTDGGQNWEKIRDGNKLGSANWPLRCIQFLDNEKGYCGGDGGHLFYTENGGASWSPVSGLPPDFDIYGLTLVGSQVFLVGNDGLAFWF